MPILIIPPKRHVKSSGALWWKKRTILLRIEILDAGHAESCGIGMFKQLEEEYRQRKGLKEIKVLITGMKRDLCVCYNAFLVASSKNTQVEDWILNEVPSLGMLFETDDGELVRDFWFGFFDGVRSSTQMKPMELEE